MTEVLLAPVQTFKQASDLQDRIAGVVFTINGNNGSSVARLSNGNYQVILYTSDLFQLARALYDEGIDC